MTSIQSTKLVQGYFVPWQGVNNWLIWNCAIERSKWDKVLQWESACSKDTRLTRGRSRPLSVGTNKRVVNLLIYKSPIAL